MKITARPYRITASLILLCGAVTTKAQYSNTVASFNPLAYWRLNEATASPALNKVANSGSLGSTADGYAVLDVGKGQPGALGLLGNSIRLVNNGNVVGYCGSKVDVPYSAGLNPKAPFTVEFWAKPNALGSDGTGFSPISCFNPNFFGGANRSGWLFYLNNVGRWEFRLGLTSGYAGICDATSGNATAGTWQHIVGTYDGTIMRIYVNGVQTGTLTPTAGNNAAWKPNTQMALRIGGTPLTGTLSDGPAISATGISGNRGYDGWMDEVAIYPTALSASAIAAHYAAATTNTAGYGAQIVADGPLGYWNMNESAVTPPTSFPTAANSGSVGSAADGTNAWGVLAAQAGAAYPGFGGGNNACFFDGENGYVALPDPAGLHFSGNITLMAWVKPRVKDFFRNIIAHGWDNNYAETFLRISRGNFDGTGNGDGNNYYEVGTTDGSGYYDAVYFQIPEGDIGNWTFIAGTYDGANWNLYRNGVLVSSAASVNGAVNVTNRWSIGSRSGPSPTISTPGAFEAEGLFFGGYIDEPAVFNTALSAANINTIYNAAQVPPVILVGPQTPAGTIYEGSTVTFSVWAEGAPTLKYFWTKDGVPNGVTTTNLTLNSVTVASSGTYGVIVTNAYGSNFASAPLTVLASAPIITKQPVSVTRFEGSAFSFSVSTIGSTPQTYYWTRGTTVVQSGPSPTYSGTASAGLAGGYYCVISNHIAPFTTISSTGTLTVLPVPTGYGGAVIASAPNAYWRLGETNGTTAGDYIGGHDGTYFSVVLNQPGYAAAIDPDRAAGFGAVNSYVGSINGDPATGGVNFQGHTNFTLEVWVNGPAGQPDESTIIAKGNGSSGTTATEQFAIDILGGKYRFFTRGNNNALFEADAAVGPNGTWQHVVGVYDDTGNALMSIYVNGELSGSGAPRGAGLRASTAAVTIGSKHLGNNPDFDGFFTGTIDEVAIYPVALSGATVQAHYAAAYGPSLAPVIDTQPQSVTNYIGLPATLSVVAHGTVPLSYQWKKGGVDISGATGSSLTITNLALSDDAGNYSVNVANSVLPAGTNSALAAIRVLSAPASPPAIPGLVLHLPFDNNLTDVTGRGNNGVGIHRTATASNAAAPSFVAGKIGQALHYESQMGAYPGPTTTNNDYVTLGVRPDLQFSSNVNLSVAFWIRVPLNFVGGDLPFFTTTVNSTFGSGIVLAPSYGSGATVANTGTDDGGWAFSFYDTAGNGVGVYGDIGSINDGDWHHLVYVFDRVNGATVYLDGVVIPSDAVPYHHSSKQAGTTAAAAENIDTGNAATIGQDPTGTYGETGSGDIDDLGIWKKALTPLEAASIYIAGASNSLSYTTAPFSLSVQKSGTTIILRWDVGVLQQADLVDGPYTDVAGATSPRTVTASGTRKFYRIRL